LYAALKKTVKHIVVAVFTISFIMPLGLALSNQ